LFAEQADTFEKVAPSDLAPLAPNTAEIAKALAMIGSAQRPLVIAGSGVWWSRAEIELREFIEKACLPLYTITMAGGIIPDTHPLCMGYADLALNRGALTAY
jgi:thiamine pyrophosphate-dependent acetolactate synthase large subunit-like protein